MYRPGRVATRTAPRTNHIPLQHVEQAQKPRFITSTKIRACVLIHLGRAPVIGMVCLCHMRHQSTQHCIPVTRGNTLVHQPVCVKRWAPASSGNEEVRNRVCDVCRVEQTQPKHGKVHRRGVSGAELRIAEGRRICKFVNAAGCCTPLLYVVRRLGHTTPLFPNERHQGTELHDTATSLITFGALTL